MTRKEVAAIALLGAALFAVPAFATMGSGASGTVHARGTIGKKVKVKEPSNTDFVTQQVTILPGGHTGWHTHPGAALVIVKSGTLTLTSVRRRDDEDDGEDERRARCLTEEFSDGESFVDPGHGNVHIARNLGERPVEFWVTYTGVPSGGATRLDASDPNC